MGPDPRRWTRAAARPARFEVPGIADFWGDARPAGALRRDAAFFRPRALLDIAGLGQPPLETGPAPFPATRQVVGEGRTGEGAVARQHGGGKMVWVPADVLPNLGHVQAPRGNADLFAERSNARRGQNAGSTRASRRNLLLGHLRLAMTLTLAMMNS